MQRLPLPPPVLARMMPQSLLQPVADQRELLLPPLLLVADQVEPLP